MGDPLKTLRKFRKNSHKAKITRSKNWSSARLEPTFFCFAKILPQKSRLTSVPSDSRSYKFSVAVEATAYETYKICHFAGPKNNFKNVLRKRRRKLQIGVQCSCLETTQGFRGSFSNRWLHREYHIFRKIYRLFCNFSKECIIARSVKA